MEGFVQVRLENDTTWEPVLKDTSFDEDVVKDFCRSHPEYYFYKVKLDGFCELYVEILNADNSISKYEVYIDQFHTFFITKVQ